jgi:DNA excision repair protein ERCC-4
MIIVHSGAEQKPWTFPPGVEVEKGPLRTGDYSVKGLQNRIVVERKSLGDFVSTVIHDWIRFTKQLRRMAAMDAAVIAVEATPDDVFLKDYVGKANPESVMGKAHAIFLDYGVPVLWWGTREAAQREAYHLLSLASSKLR